MTAEFHDPSHESTLAIEDLFDRLEARAEKEGGRGWRERRQKQILATKAIHFYVHPDAESQLAEYFLTNSDDEKSDEEIDQDETLLKLEECRVINTEFTAYRGIFENDDNDIVTYYTVELSTGSTVHDPSELPLEVKDKIETKLNESFVQHIAKRNNGEISNDEEFDEEIQLVKKHIFEMKDKDESVKYTRKESYDAEDFSVPLSTYSPAESSNANLTKSPGQPDDAPKDALWQLFDDIINAQDLNDVSAESPKNIRVTQVLAILSLLEFGEAQTVEEQKIIEDLTQ